MFSKNKGTDQGEGGGGGGVTPNPTNDYIPINNNGQFADSPLRVENGVLISSLTFQAPPESLLVGDNVKLTDGGSGLGLSLQSQNSTQEIPSSIYREESGTVVGLGVSDYIQTGAQDAPTQISDVVTNSYEKYVWEAQIFSTDQQPPPLGVEFDIFRVLRVNLRGDVGPQAPIRLRLYFVDPVANPGVLPFYDNVSAALETEWLAGNAGFLLNETGETIIEFGQGQRLRVGVKFWIEYSVPSGQQFTVKGDNVDIGFGTVFVPYQISTVLAGYEIDVAPPRERGTLSTTDQQWTTIITHSASEDKTENLNFQVYGSEDGEADRISAELLVTSSREGTDPVEIIGRTFIFRHRNTNNVNARAIESGNDILLQVKGRIFQTWNWRATVQTRGQKP